MRVFLKRFRMLFVMVFLCMGPVAVSAYQEQFLPYTDDIPLVSNFTTVDKESLSFDTPAGQIIVVTLSSSQKKQSAFESFYNQTLPALGWTRLTAGRFIRGQDTLLWHFLPTVNGTQVQFEIFLTGEV